MKKITAIMLCLVLVFSFAACGSSDTGSGENEPLVITIATTQPNNEGDAVYTYCSKFAEIVTEKTDGMITFDISGDGVLGDDTEIAEGLGLGTLQMGVTSSAAIANLEPAQQILTLPFLFENYDEVHQLVDSDIMKEMNDAVYEDGLKVLSIIDGGFRVCLNNVKPINSIEDFDGLKWRVPPMDLYVEVFNALGANATPMSGAEVFTGLQQKTIDGCEFPVGSIYSMQLYTATKYIDITNHIYTAWYACVSDDVWETLTDEQKEIFAEAAVEANEAARAKVVEVEQQQYDEIAAYGCEVNDNVDVSGMREAVEPLYDSYKEAIGEDTFDAAMELLEESRN